MKDSNMSKLKFAVSCVIAVVCAIVFTSCKPDLIVDGNGTILFDKEGQAQYPSTKFALKEPKKINFYVEMSGSMDGFFRANKPTAFKQDECIWEIYMRHLFLK